MARTGLDKLRELADVWNEFMLPGGVPEETKGALREQDPAGYDQRLADLASARTAGKEDTRRLLGSVATQIYGLDPRGEAKFPLMSTDKQLMYRPGFVDEAMALPAWFGASEENWPRSHESLRRTDQLLNQIQGKMNYTEADEPLEYFIEAAGTMAGQPPVPVGTFNALKAPFLKAGEWARKAMGPLGRVGQAASLVPRAGIEFFGPMVEPTAGNYAMGTAFGGTLRSMLDPGEQTAEEEVSPDTFLEDPEKVANPLTIGQIYKDTKAGRIDPESAAYLLEKLLRETGKLEVPGKAKGGRVKPPDLMELRKQIEQLLKTPEVEGTGQEMVPVEPAVREIPTQAPDIETQLEALQGDKPSIFETPVSRRTVLEGMASLASPVQLDPMSLLTSPAGAATRTAAKPAAPVMGVIARLNDRDGYERAAWGATPAAARKALVELLDEEMGGPHDFETSSTPADSRGVIDEFGIDYTRGLESEAGSQLEDSFEDVMAQIRGLTQSLRGGKYTHPLHPDDIPDLIGETSRSTTLIQNDEIRSVKKRLDRILETYAEDSGDDLSEVRKAVSDQVKRETELRIPASRDELEDILWTINEEHSEPWWDRALATLRRIPEASEAVPKLEEFQKVRKQAEASATAKARPDSPAWWEEYDKFGDLINEKAAAWDDALEKAANEYGLSRNARPGDRWATRYDDGEFVHTHNLPKPEKFAKGGKVKPPDLMSLRQKISELMSEAGVEGTGRELAPLSPPEDVRPDAPSLEDQLQALQGGTKPGLLETPVSRRTVLEGMASALSPVQVDPMSLLKSGEAFPLFRQELHGKVDIGESLSQATIASKLQRAWDWIVEESDEPRFDEALKELEDLPDTGGWKDEVRDAIKGFQSDYDNLDPHSLDEGQHSLEDWQAVLEEKLSILAGEHGLLVRPHREFTDEPLHILTPAENSDWEIDEFLESSSPQMRDKGMDLFTELQLNMRKVIEAADDAEADKYLAEQERIIGELESLGVDRKHLEDHLDSAVEGRDF